jgi:hypothetical protein
MLNYNVKKFFFATLLVAAGSLTGCLKDDAFEAGEYGSITGNTTGKKFISIPLARNKVNVLGVEAKAGFQDINLFQFAYDYQSPAESEMSITVQKDDALVTAADPTLILIPAAAIQIVNLTTKIQAGKVVSDKFMVKLNTDLLDPTKKYGIGFKITDIPAGIQLSSNLNSVVFAFTIKNKYDGIYQIRCHMMHPPDRSPDWVRTPFTYGYDIHLITTGPNSVKMFNTAFNAGFHPLQVPGASGFGNTEANFVFNASNQLTEVFNGFTGVTRSFVINPAVTTSKYDPATKKVFAAFIMNQTGFQPMPIFDTLTFLKTRP